MDDVIQILIASGIVISFGLGAITAGSFVNVYRLFLRGLYLWFCPFLCGRFI
ncbi:MULTISPECIES: tail virion protein G7P-2 [Enterobacteriaceae]|uniref:tail virion protein G7P-2 n=1 Tax=Enterobacteriaceae TaxID=543 RepID=UPI0032E856CF